MTFASGSWGFVRERSNNETLRVEFELYASHFHEHQHSIAGCDRLVCWLDDVGDWPDRFVIVLSAVVAEARPDLIADISDRDPKQPWDQTAFLDRASADGASARDIELMKRVIAFAKKEELGPQWLINASGTFAVGQDTQYFKIVSSGRLGFPFSRLESRVPFSELRKRLNSAVPRLELSDADQVSKGKGGQLSELFHTDAELDNFLSVWTWFRDAA